MKKMGTRENILDQADRLFGERGFDATTTREIAQACSINKALIHYHFKSKDDLLRSLLDRYYVNLGEVLVGALKGEGDLRERMLILVDTYLDFLSDNLNFARIVQREASGGKHMDFIINRMTPIFQLGADMMRSTFPKTRNGVLAAEQLLVSFYGMMIGYFTYSGVLAHLIGDDPLSAKRLKARKRHLQQMVNITVDAVENGHNGKITKRRRSK